MTCQYPSCSAPKAGAEVLLVELDREREESRKLREELAKEKYANSIIEMDRDNWISDYSELLKELQSAQQEIERLREERDKLIEGLRWYGDRETYDGNVEWDDDGNIIRAEWPPINVDNGQRARNILREIGVTEDYNTKL